MVSPVEIQSPEFATSLIRQAARETGANFEFLLSTAARESNFDPAAEARTSSAAGMYQFIEQTWLGMMDRHGADHGFEQLAGAIRRDSSGRYIVDDPAAREEILSLRFDAAASARMAGELAAENAVVIEAATGRPASSGELYAAHFLGANGAAELITGAETNPDQRADRLFPAAARANRSIFYDGGRPRTAAEVLERLTGEAVAVQAAATPAHDASLSSVQPAATGGFSGPLHTVSFSPGGGELSPMLVEILASLEAPAAARDRRS